MDFSDSSRPVASQSDALRTVPKTTPETFESPLTSTADLLKPLFASPARTYDTIKRIGELLVGAVLLVLAFPVIAAGWILVRLTSPGSGIYTQTRVGLGGRHFLIYKLRTMTHNCEATAGGAKWSTAGDSRVTPVGRVFRKLHIDELPQLVNVLLGDMSLIGPRPERPEFVKPLSASIPEYALRLAVRPGVTGLAQIQLPPDTDLGSVCRKVVLDRAYIDGRCLWLDLRLILGTAIYLLGFQYSTVRRLLGLPNPLVTISGPVLPEVVPSEYLSAEPATAEAPPRAFSVSMVSSWAAP